jgi:zinc transport system substrate-binding protein
MAGLRVGQTAWAATILLTAIGFVAGCGKSRESIAAAGAEGGAIVVSSPYLETAVREIVGRNVRLVRLANPSMCPGHFDIRPSQLRELAHCSLLVRFDFQASLDDRIGRGAEDRRKIVSVHVPSGLCVPESYLTACRQVAECFVAAGSLTRQQADDRLARLGVRMADLQKEVAGKIDRSKVRGTPVLASRHQVDFCRWLGLRVGCDISASDTVAISDIDQSIKDAEAAGVKLIIANEPEGRQAADALADRFRATVVVFANFPSPDAELPFDSLVRHNVAALLDAAQPAAGPP